MQVGELLESLGNRKSEFVVLAVTEYINAHPEALPAGQRPKIIVKSGYTREQMEAMVRQMIEEKLAGVPTLAQDKLFVTGESADIESDIDAMLKNLDLF